MTSTLKRTSSRLAAIAPSATLAVDAKAKAMKAAGENVIGFGAGEPDFATPAHIVEAAAAACLDPKNHKYSPAGGLPELKQAICDKTLRDSGFVCEPANVLVMPAVHSASIATRLLKAAGAATVIGPILVGLEKSVQVARLGAKVSDIVNLAGLAAYDPSRAAL